LDSLTSLNTSLSDHLTLIRAAKDAESASVVRMCAQAEQRVEQQMQEKMAIMSGTIRPGWKTVFAARGLPLP
jgi:hypothetical protein